MASTGLQAASWLAQSRLAVSYLKWGFDTVFRLIMNPIYLLTPVQDFLVWEGWAGWAGLGWAWLNMTFHGSLHPPAVTRDWSPEDPRMVANFKH